MVLMRRRSADVERVIRGQEPPEKATHVWQHWPPAFTVTHSRSPSTTVGLMRRLVFWRLP